jgi:hypothetical protein
MKPSTYLIRFKRLLVLGAVVAGIAVPAAGAYNGSPPDVRDAANSVAATNASPPDVRDVAANLAGATQSFVVTPPDVRDAAVALHSTPAGITADGLRLQGIAQVYKDLESSATADVFERYAKAHPYGVGLSVQLTPVDRIIAQEQGRQGDLGLFNLGLTSQTGSTIVSRPPDVSDAAEAARYGVSFSQSSSFHWSDWAIGIGSGIGLMLLVAGAFAGELQRRRMQTA